MLHWLSWKFDLHEPRQCPKEAPLTSEDFSIGIRAHHRSGTSKLCETLLVEHIQQAEAEYRKQHCNPAEWKLEDFDVLDDRVRFELLHRNGMMERWQDGLISTATIASSMESLPLERADYFQASCIRSHEFPPLVSKYGLAVIEHSLLEDDPLKAMLAEKKKLLREGLMALSEQEKLHPKVVKASDATTYLLARELYGRFEWAVKELSPVHLNMEKIQQESYRLYLEKGKDAALQHLKDWKVRPQLAKRFISQLERRIEEFRGTNCNVATSHLEDTFAATMDKLEIEYRRQVLYKEFTKTDRRLRVDFLLDVIEVSPERDIEDEARSKKRTLCIEITSVMDDHIHDSLYFERMAEKRKLAGEAGHLYIELTELDDWKGFLESIAPRAQKPEYLKHLLEEDRLKNERAKEVFMTRSSDSTHHATNSYESTSQRYWGLLDNPYVLSALRRRAQR